jgi:voltage-gated potassium channel
MNPNQPEQHHHFLSIAWQLLIFTASLATVIVLAVSVTLPIPKDLSTILNWADTVICLLFLLDFFWILIKTENKKRYLLTWGWIDLISSIPLIPMLQWGRIARIIRIFRLLRGLKSGAQLLRLINSSKRQATTLSIVLLFIATMTFSSIAILIAEKGIGTIDTPGKAVWWTLTTITTVGYGDYAPVTTTGKIVAGVTMIAGITIFGCLTALITSFVIEPAKATHDPVILKLEKMEQDITIIKTHLQAQNRAQLLESPPR